MATGAKNFKAQPPDLGSAVGILLRLQIASPGSLTVRERAALWRRPYRRTKRDHLRKRTGWPRVDCRPWGAGNSGSTQVPQEAPGHLRREFATPSPRRPPKTARNWAAANSCPEKRQMTNTKEQKLCFFRRRTKGKSASPMRRVLHATTTQRPSQQRTLTRKSKLTLARRRQTR